ncbi:hypothetical protein SK128_021210 [Halocaridina rubra]|uniref:Chitin-binding type-2 domain-containing protein n=1 Tax=Halocaridina rubra TaxID=373956 RepID=A0AAN8XH59_HALRR
MKEIAGHIQSIEGDIILGVFRSFYVPQSSNLYEGTISSSFSCSAYGQGYYADEENSCQMFHVCTPVESHDGAATQYRFTFRCAEGEQFDQRSLTCSRSSNTCSSASSLFRNSQQQSQRLFSGFSSPAGPTNTGVCYLAKNQIITGIRK